MRIIAGEAKGFTLEVPKRLQIRPTLDRVREALFSILGPNLAGAHFLDLFAGTGANGMEALSRGVASCTFVDVSQKALDFLEPNLRKTGFWNRSTLRRYDLSRSLTPLMAKGAGYDIVFADPPYSFGHYHILLEQLSEPGLVVPDGIVVLEHSKKTDLPLSAGRLQQTRQYGYGDTKLSFYS
jgi:16S rRNA (guanine(966)-N(2))-methyltransferase RsmD